MNSELAINSFREIPVCEQKGLNGGWAPIIAALAIVVVQEVISDWDNFINGLTGQPEEKESN